jgi:hypothetical protein
MELPMSVLVGLGGEPTLSRTKIPNVNSWYDIITLKAILITYLFYIYP